jgi:hypothetical protein
MTDASYNPPPPDPVWVQQRAGQIRTLIAFAGGALGGTAGAAMMGLSVEQIGAFITTVMTLMSLGSAAWSSIKSWRQKSADRALMVASANASALVGLPVVVTVTPPGQANIVTRVSDAEVSAAPSAALNNIVPPPKVAP